MDHDAIRDLVKRLSDQAADADDRRILAEFCERVWRGRRQLEVVYLSRETEKALRVVVSPEFAEAARIVARKSWYQGPVSTEPMDLEGKALAHTFTVYGIPVIGDPYITDHNEVRFRVEVNL